MMPITNTQTVMLSLKLDKPFRLAFGELYTLPRVEYRITLDNNTEGIGEASIDFPFSNYDMFDVYDALQNLNIKGKNIENRIDILEENRPLLKRFPAAFTALNMALDDAAGKYHNKSLQLLYGEPYRNSGKAMRSIAFQKTKKGTMNEILAAHEQGFLPKIKAGIGIKEDIDNLCTAEEVAKPYAVDFNGAYDLSSAEQIFDALIPKTCLQNALYFEQPTAAEEGIGSLAKIAKKLRNSNCKALVIADESFLTLEDALECTKNGIGLNFKMHKIGGIYTAKNIESKLYKAGLEPKSMLGGTFPTAIGRTYDQHAACILKSAVLYSDGWQPSTDFFASENHLILENFQKKNGSYVPQSGSGLGITPNYSKLKAFTVENPAEEYKLIRNNLPGKQITIKVRVGQNYRELYEQKSGRAWDWNLK